MRFKKKYKTARCVLRCDQHVLLAVHSSFWSRPNRRWGLPGGNIEWRESPEAAVVREIQEEFRLHIKDPEEIGAYTYKGHQHMVFGADVDYQTDYYDDSELLEIEWFTHQQIRDLARAQKLHAGYEDHAIDTFFRKSKIN